MSRIVVYLAALCALVGVFALPAVATADEATEEGYNEIVVPPPPTTGPTGPSGDIGGTTDTGGTGGTTSGGGDSGVGGTTDSGGSTSSEGTPVDNGSGTLAFTGQDLAFLLLSGVGLVLIGFGVRWLAWPKKDGGGPPNTATG